MISSVLFFIFVGFLLPFVCWRSYRNTIAFTESTDDLPSSTAVAAQALIVHGIVFGLAFACARNNSIDVSWFSEFRLLAVVVAVGIVLGAVGVALWEARRPNVPADGLRLKLRGKKVSLIPVIAVLSAAVAEEYAYRGVLYLLLVAHLAPLPSALISAIAFGLAHFGQGRRGVLISAVFGLAMQFLYHFSGALILAVAAHLLYDLIILWLGRRAHQRGHSGAVS